jgi:hypothetical protein
MRAKNRRHTAASQGITKAIIVASTVPFNDGARTGLDVTLEALLSHTTLEHTIFRGKLSN